VGKVCVGPVREELFCGLFSTAAGYNNQDPVETPASKRCADVLAGMLRMIVPTKTTLFIAAVAVCAWAAGLVVPVAGAGVPRVLKPFLDDSGGGFEEIVFAARQPGAGGHWYENFGCYAQDTNHKIYRAGGRLCRLNLKTGKVAVLLDDPQGSVRDPQVHYGGARILFSYRRAGSDYFHLYEINVDGSGLRQITCGPYDDIEPTYLADGGIMFCSSRCKRWVNCWYSPVAVLYRCEADGSGLRPVSANIEHDNTPWPLPDGRVLYQRWEYVDRSRVAFHHLWTCNPDGTGQMVYYGNMHPRTLMIDAKPIPGTDNKVAAIFSPGHGRAEHAGAVTIISPKSGPDDIPSARRVSRGENYRDPYPLGENCFLVAEKASLLVMDGRGNTTCLYTLDAESARAGVQLHEPRPIRRRKRERLIPSRLDLKQPTGRLVLADVYEGRNMTGVKRGEIKKLLVLETLPKPVNYSGKMPPMTFGGTFTLAAVLGTVPVEADGSAYMELPAMRSLFFVALDKDNNSVKRMHSFLTVQPGETTSCLGCHEQRTRTLLNPGAGSLAALRRPPSRIRPIARIPQVFDFPRDIQPILDKHCVSCHDYDRREGGVVLCGDYGPIYSHSFYTLTVTAKQVSDGRDRLVTNLPPRAVGTSASDLMRKIDGSHHDVRLTAVERDTIRYWIESGAAYPGTYAALGTGMIGGFPKSKLDTSDRAWPESVAAAEAVQRRCTGCHDKTLPMPGYLSDNLGFVLSNPDFDDIRCRFSRHLLFNLTRPEKSLILLGPLAREAGGYGSCRQRLPGGRFGKPVTVFKDTADADYQRILALCRAGKRHLEKIRRFDMPNFRPRASYIRQMKRYGILPADLPPDAPIDVYATDEKYWRSLRYHSPDMMARRQ